MFTFFVSSSDSESEPLSLSLLRRAAEAFLSLALVSLLPFLLPLLWSLLSLLFPDEALDAELDPEESGERDLDADFEEARDLLDAELRESDEELRPRDLDRSEAESESELPLILLLGPILKCLNFYGGGMSEILICGQTVS